MRATLALVALSAALLLGLSGTAFSHALKNPNPSSCTDEGDRITKIQLLEKLSTAPHVLVLGSSRARPAMPATLKTLTGGPAFNAGVQGGTTADTYVFTRLLAQRFPKAKPAYLIFVDFGIASDAVNAEMADEPLARPFLGGDASSKKTTCVGNNGYYDANGGLTLTETPLAQRLKNVADALSGVLAGIPADSKKHYSIDPAKTTYLQKLLKFVNAQGATPVVVLNPLYPAVLAAREKYGFPQLKAANTYIAWLHQHYRFIFRNCEDIRTWGGTSSDFANIDHIDRTNMDRLLKYVVAHSNGVLIQH